jgi:Protein of unknown function (DUF1073)
MSTPGGEVFSAVTVGVGGSAAYREILDGEDIVAGLQPSYQLCKEIYLYHPLGAKMTEGPIKLAMSQERVVTVQDAPDEVKKAFTDKWAQVEVDDHILNVHTQARIYGIASIIMVIEGFASDKPAKMESLFKQSVFFNVLDPLNTSGSLVLSQVPTSPNFQKPQYVRTYGETFHPSRSQVVMNEMPIYISYTNSAFGFVGRSVYQRALQPLKAFLVSMVADMKIQQKLSVLVVKMKSPGSIVNKAMSLIAGWKRWLLKSATNGNVITIDPEEDVSAIDMTNVDGAGTYSRNNIIRNIESAADMPARMLDQETMVSGFGEGTEDAKRNALYIQRIRVKMRPTYSWFTNIVQYMAWNPVWYRSVIQAKYDDYKNRSWEDAFMEWRNDFQSEWPSLLIEPESEEIKKEEVKLEAVVSILTTLMPQLDAENKAKLIQWAADCFGENKRLFPHEIELNWETLAEHMEQNEERDQESHEAEIAPDAGGGLPGGKKIRKDSAGDVREQLTRLRTAVAELHAMKRSPAQKLQAVS